MRSAEEVLKIPRPFWVKLPHAARPPLAQKNPTDQHYLNNVNKIDALLGKASDATLQSLHFINGSPVQPLIDP